MKRKSKILIPVFVLLLFLTTLLASTAMAMPDPLRGSWVATDVVDDSSMRLTIGGSGTPYRLNLYDDGATVCGLDGDGNPEFAARATGTGTLSGNELSGDWQVFCLARPSYEWGSVPFIITYDSGTITLSDSFGSVWTRR